MFFQAQDYFKQSSTRLNFIADKVQEHISCTSSPAATWGGGSSWACDIRGPSWKPMPLPFVSLCNARTRDIEVTEISEESESLASLLSHSLSLLRHPYAQTVCPSKPSTSTTSALKWARCWRCHWRCTRGTETNTF